MLPCRLIVDPPLEGAWNMALDEALLEEAAERGGATLRFYQWCEPTLSLGYFQAYEERQSHAASRETAVVRRQSGGGALIHDRELTYALILPPTHPIARQSTALYDLVHRTLIDLLAARGMAPALHRDQANSTNSVGQAKLNDEATSEGAETQEPFLCFARRTAADVVLPVSVADGNPAKIVGSAQRRRRGAVLQHGSVLLDRSPSAPELAGIGQLTGIFMSPEVFIEPWSNALAAAIALEFWPTATPLDARLLSRAKELRAEKYGNSSWTMRR